MLNTARKKVTQPRFGGVLFFYYFCRNQNLTIMSDHPAYEAARASERDRANSDLREAVARNEQHRQYESERMQRLVTELFDYAHHYPALA